MSSSQSVSYHSADAAAAAVDRTDSAEEYRYEHAVAKSVVEKVVVKVAVLHYNVGLVSLAVAKYSLDGRPESWS